MRRKGEAEELDDYPKAREYALVILECIDAPTWLSLHELARAHTAGKISYAAWKTAASKVLQVAARQMRQEVFGD